MFLFFPKGIINKTIIKQEWDNILRIVASLATKTTSQSIIVRKLAAFPRKNNTCKALDSLDKIIKSIHILRYIGNIDFRQHIQKSINRGEAYHSLKRAIFYDNQGKFRVLNELEQNTWSECTRLLALFIIYYNAFLLSNIEHRLSKDNQAVAFLRQISPIQWRHVDMYGKFFFESESNEERIQEILSTIEEMDFTPFH